MYTPSIKDYIILFIFGISNTFLSVGTIYIINNVLTKNAKFLDLEIGITFTCFVVYSYLLSILFQKKIIKISYSFVYDHELKVFKTLKEASLKTIEKYGTDRLYGIIEDLRVFIFFPGIVTSTLNSLLLILVSIVYMFSLSVYGTVIILVVILIVSIIYIIINKYLSKKVSHHRDLNDLYYEYMNDSIKGFKELKLSFQKRNVLFKNYLESNRQQAQSLDMDIASGYLSINLLSQYGLYIILAIILFLLPAFEMVTIDKLIPFIIIILFISAPISTLIANQSFYTRAMVARERVKQFFKDFETDMPSESKKDREDLTNFNKIEFTNIKYEYLNSNFKFDLETLTLNKGEVIFIIGGNGSGKSTFINLLTGLYTPESGNILIDKNSVNTTSGNYHDLFSAVFTDHHLFAHNYNEHSVTLNSNYKELLKLFEMDAVVSDSQDKSARRNFSKGQAKRMALIFALLEEKPILVLDEWAADQDPYFRKYFYETIIDKLKSEGKTIVAVTHDDKYFSHADRVLKFEYGRITRDVIVQQDINGMQNLLY